MAVSDQHIEVTPGVMGGRPRIAGHRIRVQDVATWHDSLGLTPEEIVARHPGVGLADVHAALAYYYDHLEEIRRDIEADRTFAEAVRTQIPSKLAVKLGGRDVGTNPLPPR